MRVGGRGRRCAAWVSTIIAQSTKFKEGIIYPRSLRNLWKQNMVTPAFLAGKEYGEYMQRQEEMIRRVVIPLGLVKQ
jgi:hypothetical protein